MTDWGVDSLGLGFDLGEHRDGAASGRRYAWEWDVLNSDMEPCGTVAPALLSTPTVAVTVTGNVNRSARGLHLVETDAAGLDPARDFLSPVLVDPAGTRWRQGVFRVADAATVDRAKMGGTYRGTATVELTLADESVRLQAKTNRAVGFARGLAPESAAQQIATWLNIPNIEIDPTTTELETPLSWPLGEPTWAEVCSTVAKSAGFLNPYFDNNGVWRWRTAPVWEAATPDFTYSTDAGGVVFDGMERSVAILGDPNVFYAVNASAGTAPIVGRYGLPPYAPNSVARLGYEIPEVVEAAGLGGQDAADNSARAAAAENPAEIGDASLTVPHDPAVDLFALVVVDGWRYRGTGCRFAVSGSGLVTHDLARLWLPSDTPGGLLDGLL
jgi:hypothetical protein